MPCCVCVFFFPQCIIDWKADISKLSDAPFMSQFVSTNKEIVKETQRKYWFTCHMQLPQGFQKRSSFSSEGLCHISFLLLFLSPTRKQTYKTPRKQMFLGVVFGHKHSLTTLVLDHERSSKPFTKVWAQDSPNLLFFFFF